MLCSAAIITLASFAAIVSSAPQASFFPLIPTSNTVTPPLSSSFFPLIPAPPTTTPSTSLGNSETGQTSITSQLSTTLPPVAATSASNNGSIISATSPATTTSTSSASTFRTPSTPIVNCQQNIPPDGPAPSLIANALQGGDGTGNGIADLCADDTFDDTDLGDSTHMTFLYGSISIELIRISPALLLRHCNDALNAIVATCIMGSADYGGIYSQDGETYNITNLIAPANPLAFPPSSTTTAATAPTAPPTPSQIRSNNHGSALCDTLAGSCKVAYTGYNDTYLYTQYTSYLADPGNSDGLDLVWDADDGCAAMFTCDNDAAYAVGMLGSQIKAAFENLFDNDHVRECGSSYLSNSCNVTVNGCSHCKASIPCGSLPAGAPNGSPCNT